MELQKFAMFGKHSTKPINDRSWAKFHEKKEGNVMNSVNISSPVEQKLAALKLTDAIRERFELRPHALAEDIRKQALKINCTPLEVLETLKKFLPQLVSECLTETQGILEQPKERRVRLVPASETNPKGPLSEIGEG